MRYNIAVIVSSCFLQMKQSFSRSMFKYCLLINPIIYSLIMYMIYRDSNIQNYVSSVLIGTGVLSTWTAICFSSVSDIQREKMIGTIEVIAAAPPGFKLILLGKVIGNTLLSSFTIVITFLFIKYVIGEKVFISNPIYFSISMLLLLISLIGLSMLMAALVTLSRNTHAFMNSLGYPIYILCGLMFPIEVLPLWVRFISYTLSPTWAVKLLRISANGIIDYNDFFYKLLALIILTILYSIFAHKLLDRIDRETRVKAVLEVY